MAIVLCSLLLIPNTVKADGKYGRDITVSGKVVTAIIDDTTGKAYVLKPAHKGTPLPEAIKMGEKVSVFGDEIKKGHHLSLRVEKVNQPS